MAKKSAPQVNLSPENYIRQKARNLPIYECRVNPDWKEVGSASAMIARKHANGNLTYGVYLVDVLCLGVKQTYFQFNAEPDDYREMLESMSNLDMQVCDYNLIHNIIYAAIEFASDYGFKPVKDYTAVTQYLMEEDTDDIELMEIECGRDGRPVFVISEEDNRVAINQTISVLEKTAGKGNFDVVYETDDDTESDTDEPNEYDELDAEERKNLFLELSTNELMAENISKLDTLMESIFQNDLCDQDELDDMIEGWLPEFQIKISKEPFTTQQLGLPEHRTLTSAELEQFIILSEKKQQNTSEAPGYIEELRMQWGDMPYLRWMEIELCQDKNSATELAKQYFAQFPDYPMLKMANIQLSFANTDDTIFPDISIQHIFGNRAEITEYEMFRYQVCKLQCLLKQPDPIYMQAIYESYDILELSKELKDVLLSMIMIERINFLKAYFQ